MEKREEVVYVRLTPSEKDRITEKMKDMGIRNISAYARKMLLDGYCVKLDLTDIRELVRLTGYAGNNLNQYARCAHETMNIYAADVEDLKVRFDRIIALQKQILERLSTI
jgi:23S rRNA U2552 (ribose-2'-O)-methylase RlmE/FtsJ